MRDPRRFAWRVAGGLAALCVLVFLVQAWWVATALADGRAAAKPLQDAIVKGDVSQARAELEDLDRATTRAHHGSDGPLWWLGSKIPLLGRNIAAVSTVSREMDAIADEAMPRIVSVADQIQLETFRPKDGQVDVNAVRRIVPVLKTTDRVFSHADAEVSAIQADRLIGPLVSPVSELQERVHDATVAASSAADVGSLMPGMLGSDGKTRRYLMLVLNNAEVRTLSGIPGSVAVITARNGKVEMGQQGGILDLAPHEKSVMSIKAETRAGFLSSVGSDMRDTTVLPHFPRAAELVSAIVGKHWEEKYDGVVTVDPVALGYILGGLGAVSIGDGMVINQGNAASTLMHGIYIKYPNQPVRQDDAFELAARRSFDALTSGRGNSVAAIRGLVRGVQERRIMLWSRDRSEQSRIRTGGISGALSTDRHKPEVGFFLNDAGGWKITYYLRSTVKLEAQECARDGSQLFKLTGTLRSDAPQSAKRMPISVTGQGRYVRPGEMRVHALIMGPLGGRITSLTVDGKPAPVGAARYMGHPLARVPRVLPPGESSMISADIVAPPRSSGQPSLRVTPGAWPDEVTVGPTKCEQHG
jgi:hypothetical protein